MQMLVRHGAGRAQGLGLGKAAVPDVQRKTGRGEPGRHRLAHQADAEECQGRKCGDSVVFHIGRF
jgi:hypothetical protein